MDPSPANLKSVEPAHEALGAVDALEARLAQLRELHASTRDRIAQREAEVAAREREIAARTAALDRRESDLVQRETDLAAAMATLAGREADLDRVRQRLEALRHTLSALQAGEGSGADLESLISAAVKRAVDTQREMDHAAFELEAARKHAAAATEQAAQALRRAESLENDRRELEERLGESQALCARVQGETESLIEGLHGEIKRLAKERDALQTRLDKLAARLERAGLEIEWEVAKRKKK